MRPRVFMTADLHLKQASILKFNGASGVLLRPGFRDVEHMNEVLCQNWTEDVRPGDKVYCLGDMVCGANIDILKSLPGTKVLVEGNHDDATLANYAKVFKDVRATHRLAGLVLSHIPLHPCSIGGRFAGVNVHGHLHDRFVKIVGTDEPDPRYYSVSVERHAYRPVPLEKILEDCKEVLARWRENLPPSPRKPKEAAS